MRVLIAPGSFGDAVPASAAAEAIARGWRTAAPHDVLDLLVLPDGGPVPGPSWFADVDLVVTGERVFDAVSLLGATGAVAASAQRAGVPCLVLAGRVHVGRREAAARGVDEAHALVEAVGLEAAMAEPARHLRELAARTARQWSAG